MTDIKELLHKKVAGVPVLYGVIAAIVVGGALGYEKYIAKKATSATTTDTPTGTDTTGATDTQDSGDFSAFGDLTSGGLVGTTPPVDVTAQPNPTAATTNQEWASEAINWLVQQNKATGGDAQSAITLYINGNNLSYAQGELRDDAIKEFGVPPEPLPGVGQTASQPAQRQFNTPPGTHTVKGNSDNNMYDLAVLYYGNGDLDHVNLIRGDNPNLNYSLAIGAQVKIPALTNPKYFTATTATRTAAAIAAKNGISQAALIAFNVGQHSFPVAANTKVRVG